MADSGKLDLVHKAICSGIMGHIQWKDSTRLLVRKDPELKGITPEKIREWLRQFVLGGNCLECRNETRTEWREEFPNDPYWYRALIPVSAFTGVLFVELKLIDDDPEEPWVEIVSAHQQID